MYAPPRLARPARAQKRLPEEVDLLTMFPSMGFPEEVDLLTMFPSMGFSGSASSYRRSSGSGSHYGHTYVETDGDDGTKLEHHKDGGGKYSTHSTDRPNDGKVREKMCGMMGDITIREKEGSEESRWNVTRSYVKDSGSYNVITNNCQHASNKASRLYSCMQLAVSRSI